MKKRVDPPVGLRELAGKQAGVVSTEQCLAHGLTRHTLARLTARDWTALASGLYCLSTPSWQSHAWAALLAGGEGAVIGGLAAAHLHDLAEQPTEIAVWTRARRRPRRIGEVPVRFVLGEREAVGEPDRTRVAATICDCAALLGVDDIVGLTTRALTRRLITQAALGRAVNARARLAHREVLLDLAGVKGRGLESPLEWRFARDVIRAHGLPQPVLQPSLRVGTRSDAWFAEFSLIVELDGHTWHQDRQAADRMRDNESVLEAHAPTLRYGLPEVLTDPCAVARQVGRALRRGGWDGVTTSCPRCRRLPDGQ